MFLCLLTPCYLVENESPKMKMRTKVDSPSHMILLQHKIETSGSEIGFHIIIFSSYIHRYTRVFINLWCTTWYGISGDSFHETHHPSVHCSIHRPSLSLTSSLSLCLSFHSLKAKEWNTILRVKNWMGVSGNSHPDDCMSEKRRTDSEWLDRGVLSG